MSQAITVQLSDELAAWLAETAERTGVPQDRIIREQLEKAKAAKADKPFMRLAGSMKGLPKDLSTRKGYSR